MGLDLLEWAPLIASCSLTGSEAYPPELMLAIVLFELHDGRLSPARWARDARHNEILKWFGFAIQPSRSRCYAFRDRMAGRFVGLLQQVLRRAVEQGLTTAERAALDGTACAAVASRQTLLNQATLQKRIEQLDAAGAADLGAALIGPPCAADLVADTAAAPYSASFVANTAAAPCLAALVADTAPRLARRPAWMASTAEGRRRQRGRYDARRTLTARIATNARRPPSERRDPAKLVISASEPGAVLGLDKNKVYRPLYNVQLAYGLDSEFVLGCGVFALPTDIGTLGPMLKAVEEQTGRRLKILLADAKYVNMIDVEICVKENVILYAPEGNDVSLAPAPAPAMAKSKSKASRGLGTSLYYGHNAEDWGQPRIGDIPNYGYNVVKPGKMPLVDYPWYTATS